MTERLTCSDVEALLDDYLDGELSVADTESVDEHLALCASCSEERSFEESLLAELKCRLREVTPPPDLVTKVDSVIAASGHRTPEDPPIEP